ncbi:hypothetical protein [Rubinisphaera brasiliensis]|uniref:Uncharacterized protein n=1 Tax=Rubinisphaera brasiliensis (strain ATCC 49424 / DSM 5305 / JCM 21570 / IAM 15109 / NBRC 103401 / IFAM 1448) TaxID=756272 RepID=F0SQ72_RUBBR|nr:hypothetical protein [Rubinisphaera brasiliensis]ADY61249.1 hypothetical protein Plabr_3652 [Rubinisphaera brasiliensis DSM 5305]
MLHGNSASGNSDCHYRHEQFYRIDTRFIIRENNVACCPVCGCSEVHLGQVSVYQGHESTHCYSDSTKILPSDRHRQYRGSGLHIKFHCEWGHEFAEVLSFHKGATTRTMYARRYDSEVESLDELWRD